MFIIHCKWIILFKLSALKFIYFLPLDYILFFLYWIDYSFTGMQYLTVYFCETHRCVILHIVSWKTTHRYINPDFVVWCTTSKCVNIDSVFYWTTTRSIGFKESHSFISQCPFKNHIIYIFFSIHHAEICVDRRSQVPCKNVIDMNNLGTRDHYNTERNVHFDGSSVDDRLLFRFIRRNVFTKL